MEEDEELAEQEESSRLDEVEEMVRDMVLVFFCTLWTLRTTHQNGDILSHLRRRLFKALSLVFVRLTVPCFRRSRRQRQKEVHFL